MLENIDLRIHHLTKLASEIEDTLAPLIYSQIQEQLPEIFDKIIGLELVEEENNGVKSLVIVSFNINGQYFIMPIIYSNGILKPLILLYNVKSKVFLPATKKIVSFLNKPPVGVAVEPVPDNKLSNAITNPDLMSLLKFPLLAKYANLKSIFLKEYDYPSFKEIYKTASNKNKLAFLRKISENKDLALAVLAEYPEVKNLDKNGKPQTNSKKKTHVLYDPSPEYSAEVNQAIYDHGYYIIEGEDLTTDVEPETMQSNIKYMTPAQSGLYNVISKDGNLFEMWCLVSNNNIYVVEPGSFKTSVLVRKPESVIGELISTDLEDLYESCIPAIKVHNGTYLPIDKHGNTINPPIYFENGDVSNYRKKVVINPKTHEEIYEMDNTIIFSPETRMLKIKVTDEFCPGTYNDYFTALRSSGIETVTLNKEADNRYTLLNNDGIPLFSKTANDAFLHLVLDHKIPGAKAIDMLHKRGSFFLIKQSDAKTVFPTYEIRTMQTSKPPKPMTNFDPNNLNTSAGGNIYLAPEIDPQNSVEDDIRFGISASESGISKVLDSALIGILANSDNDIERNKEMLPILHKATHMLGVTLFSMWWKPMSYTESFITEEFYNLEQNLLDVFKKLGEIALTITLNRKL